MANQDNRGNSEPLITRASSSQEAIEPGSPDVAHLNNPPRSLSVSWASRVLSASAQERNPQVPKSRRPSVTDKISSLANAGGANSFNNFAKSWSRAADFRDAYPYDRSYSSTNDSGDTSDSLFARSDFPHTYQSGSSLLRAAIDHDSAGRSSDQAAHGGQPDHVADYANMAEGSVEQRIQRKRSMARESMSFSQRGARFSSPVGSYRKPSYGTAADTHAQPSDPGRLGIPAAADSGKETEPLLGPRIQPEDEEEMIRVIGHSTLPQTVFNSVNVLVGVGLLSLPLAMAYSGWVIGLVFFLLTAVVTSYTAKLLAKCLDVDDSLQTFADIAYVSYGQRARLAVSVIFLLELLGACVALVVLFADSVNALIPAWGQTEFKIVCGIVLMPLAFVPLKYLSFTSVLGILSCCGIIIAIVIDGLVKPHAPGSLREPATTYLFPADWRTLPLSFGLLMAPWGGHGVFPNLYRDMRHPKKYGRAVNYTYVFTYGTEVVIAIVGYLMFGSGVRDEITSNIFMTKGYPRWLSIGIVVAIAIIPITKIPLNARPIITTIEIFFGVDARSLGPASAMTGMTGFSRGLIRCVIRILTTVVFVLVAIAVPSFDRIMGLLGSFACFNICVVFPAAFHLKLFGKDLSRRQRAVDWLLIVVCSTLAILGTISAFLPKDLLGVKS